MIYHHHLHCRPRLSYVTRRWPRLPLSTDVLERPLFDVEPVPKLRHYRPFLLYIATVMCRASRRAAATVSSLCRMAPRVMVSVGRERPAAASREAAASSAASSYPSRGRWCSSCRSSTIGAGGWRTGRAGCRSRPFGTQLLASCPGRTMPCSLGRAALGMNSLFSRGYWLPLSGRWLESSTDCDARPANQNK